MNIRFLRRRLPCIVLAVLGCTATDFAVAADDLFDVCVSALKERESTMDEFEALVVDRETAAKDHNSYFEAQADYKFHLLRFFGTPGPRPTPVSVTHTKAGPTRYTRILKATDGSLRLMLFNGEPNGDFSNLKYSECLRGTTWERFNPVTSTGPRVTLSADGLLLQSMAVLGLLFPEVQVTNGSLATVLETLAADSSKDITVSSQSDAEGHLRMSIHLFLPAHHPKLLNETTLTLAEERGFAPIEVSGFAVNGSTGERDAGTHGYTAKWTDWNEYEPGLHVARKLRVLRFGEMLAPRDLEQGFQKLVVDGQVVMEGGSPKIDPASSVVTKYDIGIQEYECLSFEPNPTLVLPLCQETYPSGTIVQDDRTNEVFQLSGMAPATEAALHRQLEPVKRHEIPKSVGKSFPTRWLIAVNVILVIAVLMAMYWRSRIAR